LDEREERIEVLRYGEEKRIIEFKRLNEGGHDGDARLVRHLYSVLTGSGENRTSLKESVECHLMGISAEESRLCGGALTKVHK